MAVSDDNYVNIEPFVIFGHISKLKGYITAKINKKSLAGFLQGVTHWVHPIPFKAWGQIQYNI